MLITKGLTSDEHFGVRAIFNLEFVNTGLTEKEQGIFYSNMFDRRQKDDCKDFVTFEKSDVEEWIKQAETFIVKIEQLTLKIIEEEK